MSLESSVALALFLDWLNQARSTKFRAAEIDDSGGVAADERLRLALEVHSLAGPTANSAWLAARQQLERRLSEGLSGSYALWLPAGAELPAGEPLLSEFAAEVQGAAAALAPGDRSYVPLPIKLYLRKTSDEGGVVSVSGGLNPYWARFTDLVRGTYDLDSRQLHRLAEGEEHLASLIETIVDRTKKMTAGQWAEIDTIDAWTIQRRPDDDRPAAGGMTIVGVPPAEAEDAGLAVRRNFRRILAAACPQLRAAAADARALVAIGYYARMEQEGATIAMRGYDPSLYAGIDFVVLVTDGLVKPLIEAPAGALPRRDRASPG